MKVQIWPAECPYFGTKPKKDHDGCFHFIDLIAQRACFNQIAKPFGGLQDDIFTLAASLAKVRWLHETKLAIGSGVTRMVATEIDYIFSACRSIFDLLQEILFKLWEQAIPSPCTRGKEIFKENISRDS